MKLERRMDYIFVIRFDDDGHSLSATNGLPIDSLGELLVSLGKAVGLKKEDRLTLSEIRGNCYALSLTTDNESLYRNMDIIHKRISDNEYSGLSADQRKYATKLHAIMGKRYRVNTYSPNEDFNYKITGIQPVGTVDSYYEIDEVYGVIAAIGGASMDSSPSIKLSKEGYEISVSGEQEKKLIGHYKKERLLLTVRKKMNAETNKIESVELLDFEVAKSGDRMVDKVEQLMSKYAQRGLFLKVNDSSLEVRGLRGYINPGAADS
jgi:hypothetical protein